MLASPGPGSNWGRWVVLKEFVLTAGRQISMTHRRQQRQRIQAALQKVQDEVKALSSHTAQTAALTELQSAVAELKEEVWSQASRVAFAASAMWRDHGERTTAWHFAQAGKIQNRSPIKSLLQHDGTRVDMSSVQSGLDLHGLVSEHFSGACPDGLFAERPTVGAAQDRLLVGLPFLSSMQALKAEGPSGDGSITQQCLSTALSSSRLGAAPGRDGLPYEVFKVLWQELGQPMTDALTDLFVNGILESSWAEGVIIPIFKGKSMPADCLSSYRPISLLNCDLKLAQRVISDRLQHPLDILISPAQTAFLRGRSIADSVLLTQGLMEHLESTGQAGALLVLDIKQAYDRVDRTWLRKCAQAMRLPVGCMRWLDLFMTDTRSRVLLNGHITPDFPVTNGLPQGGPLAPLLWVLQLQPLTAAFERAQRMGRLQSPLLPPGICIPPVDHHADDTKLFVRDIASDGLVVKELIQEYVDASGAIMHEDKRVGVCMGSHAPIHGSCPVTLASFGQPGDPPVTSLGVPMTTDMTMAASIVFPKRIAAVKALRHLWRPFPLSLAGRALNAKQLMASTICYHATYVPVPAPAMTALNAEIIAYVATSSFPEDATIMGSAGRVQLLPKQGIACLPSSLGGLSVPDVHSQALSLQAKVLANAFSPGFAAWKALMLHALASAAPAPCKGPSWVFTPDIPIPSSISPRVSAFVTALRACSPCINPAAFDSLPLRALLLLPLPALSSVMPGVPAWPLQVPASWPYLLGQLVECPQATRADPALEAYVAALPRRLCEAVEVAGAGEAALRAHDEWWLSQDSSLLAHGLDPGHPRCVYAVHRSGALGDIQPLSSFTAAAALPACVLKVPKPKYLWSADDLAAMSAAPPSQRALLRPMQLCVLGAWSSVSVHPAAWSVAGLPLHHFSSAAARARLTATKAVAALSERMPDYIVDKPLRPHLWPRPSAAASSGLVALEAQWARQHASHSASLPAGSTPSATVLLPCQQVRSASFHRPASIRRAAALPVANGLAGGSAFGGQAALHAPQLVPAPAPLPLPPEPALQPAAPHPAENDLTRNPWAEMQRLPLSNRVKVFAVRLLHGALPCRAMVAAMRARPRVWVACPSCTADSARQRPVPAETYSHIFLECPSYRPAVQWLARLWGALSTSAPPLNAATIITAAPGSWQPAQARAPVWHSLRLLTLFAIWEARMSDDPALQAPAAVVASIIRAVETEIRLQFARCCERDQHARHLPLSVLAMRTLQCAKNGFAAWSSVGLCHVLAGGQLVVSLSASWPVLAPA